MNSLQGVDHQLVGLPAVPGIEVDRAAFGVDDAVESLVSKVNPTEDEPVPFGLDEVAGNLRIAGGEVRVEDVRAHDAEGDGLPTSDGVAHPEPAGSGACSCWTRRDPVRSDAFHSRGADSRMATSASWS